MSKTAGSLLTGFPFGPGGPGSPGCPVGPSSHSLPGIPCAPGSPYMRAYNFLITSNAIEPLITYIWSFGSLYSRWSRQSIVSLLSYRSTSTRVSRSTMWATFSVFSSCSRWSRCTKWTLSNHVVGFSQAIPNAFFTC